MQRQGGGGMRADIGDATQRVSVTVTFLRMDRPPVQPLPPLPPGAVIRALPDCSVAQYRALYNGVGGPHLWWLRRVMPDRELAQHLRRATVVVTGLYADGALSGFYELDSLHFPTVNLSYFGLMPQAIGRGFGRALLRHAVDAAWRQGAHAITVNTCTADHPRAMPTYKEAGFQMVREVHEQWHVPVRLGLAIPAHLLARGSP